MITQNKDVKKYFSNLNCKKLFKYKFKIFALRNKIELSMEYSYSQYVIWPPQNPVKAGGV